MSETDYRAAYERAAAKLEERESEIQELADRHESLVEGFRGYLFLKGVARDRAERERDAVARRGDTPKTEFEEVTFRVPATPDGWRVADAVVFVRATDDEGSERYATATSPEAMDDFLGARGEGGP